MVLEVDECNCGVWGGGDGCGAGECGERGVVRILVSDLPDYSGLAPMPGNATVLLQRPRKRNVGYQLCESTGRVTVMSLTWALVPGTT